ncbi:MAG: VOC family protein [Chloroflexota bacterium]|nr:VOC family protein [Chloroflexota bacterium]
MATGIDHIVIAVRDLDQAVADYTAAGFTVTPGGEHTNGETHNALVAFADGTYFEIIAWKDPDGESDNAWLRRLQAGEGFVDYALRTADLEVEIARLRDEGLDVPDSTPGGRMRPDGQAVEWQTVRLDPSRHPSLPFYCHSTNDITLRVPTGDATIHANGASGIHKIFIGVADLEQAAADYRIVAGITFAEDAHEQPEANKWQQFRVGTYNIVLIEPDEPASELARSIALRGEVPIEVALKSTNEQGSAVDPRLTHGAKLAILEVEHTFDIPEWEQQEDAL